MSTQYPFTENDNYKAESVLDSTVLVEDGVVWDQEEVHVALSYTNDSHETLTENNNETYLTANESSNDTQYFSVLETTNDNETTILNDLSDITTVCNNDADSESTQDQPSISSMCTIGGQPDIYRIEGSDELYAFEIACDQEGNIQRFRYRLRPNENGEYESVPESIELLPLDSETESDPSQVSHAEVPEHEEDDTEPQLEANVKVFVKEEYLHEQETILPDLSSASLDESNAPEDSSDELQVNEDESEMPFEDQTLENDIDTKAGIIEHSFLPVNKIEAISHYKSEETSTFHEALLDQPQHSNIPSIHHNEVGSSIHNDEVHSSIHGEDSQNFTQMCAVSEQEENDSAEDTDTAAEHEQPRYELLIHENESAQEEQTNLSEDVNVHEPFVPELDDSSQNTVDSHHSEDSDDHFESQHNIEYLGNINENESDMEDFHIVDGVHVTADTEQHDEASHVIEALIEREQPVQHQILKLQQQIPVLQSTGNDFKVKKLVNKNLNKVSKSFMYYVVKHPEKENVATIAHHTGANKVVKTNPRSVLKSSYSYFEQKKEKEKPPIQKIEKKLVKNKEALQARVFHNYIAKTTILHAPVRQQRLPRKQTIKPVERADEEIIVQEVVVSSNGFIETSEDGIVKSKIPLKATEIVQLSDSDDDYDPKREHKRKKRQKKRKSRVPEIVISDSEDEIDEYVVQIDLSADSGEEGNEDKKANEQDSDKTTKRLRRTSQKSAELTQSTSNDGDSSVKKKRGRPPKRRNSTNDETSVTDGSSSSKKQRRNTKDSLESSESSGSKSEEQAATTDSEFQRIKTKWKCGKCPKTFPSQGSLKSHMQYHNFHEPNNRNLRQSTGKQEGTTFKKPETAVAPQKSKYECSLCREIFKNNFLLMRHKKEHSSSGKHFECSICRKVFTDRSQLLIHKRTHIKEQMFKTTTLPKHSPKSTNVIKKRPFQSQRKPDNHKCNFCMKVFTTLPLLNAHARTHKSFTCSTCAATFISKLALEDHVRQNCVKQLKSPMRRLSLKTRKSFLAPPQRVSKRISLRKSFSNNGVLASNSPGTSSSDKGKNKSNMKPSSVKCDNCAMSFATHRALFSHKVVKHGLVTPDKRVGASSSKRKTYKESGKHSSVPAGAKMRTAFSNLRTMFEK